MNNTTLHRGLVAICFFALTACGGGSGGGNSTGIPAQLTDNLEIPDTYTFGDKFGDKSTSSVSYSGQIKRHILIEDLVTYILGLSREEINEKGFTKEDILQALNFYFEFNESNSDEVNYLYSLEGQSIAPGPQYGNIASGKSLIGKIAGEDGPLIDGELIGWNSGLDGTPTAVALVNYFFELFAENSTSLENRTIGLSNGDIADITQVYITENGLDLRQLIQKFLLGAVTYSQGTADYLKADYSTNNDSQEVSDSGEAKPYSIIEHEWDEAFGYFGAARNYNALQIDETSGNEALLAFRTGFNDANGDEEIDLESEVNLGNSTNCAKRDFGSITGTKFGDTAFNAFLLGRTILNSTSDNLTEEELEVLTEAALTASRTWEKCIAATVVHYINDTIEDMSKFSNNAYTSLDAFTTHVKHWAEMKGFALGLQFNPDSPFRANDQTRAQLLDVLELMGDAPVLADGTQEGALFTGGVAAYQADLEAALAIIQTIYEFDPADVAAW